MTRTLLRRQLMVLGGAFAASSTQAQGGAHDPHRFRDGSLRRPAIGCHSRLDRFGRPGRLDRRGRPDGARRAEGPGADQHRQDRLSLPARDLRRRRSRRTSTSRCASTRSPARSTRRRASPSASAIPATTTSCAPTRSRTMCASIAWSGRPRSQFAGADAKVPSRQLAGAAAGRPRQPLRSLLRRQEPLQRDRHGLRQPPAAWRCGPRPTASPRFDDLRIQTSLGKPSCPQLHDQRPLGIGPKAIGSKVRLLE